MFLRDARPSMGVVSNPYGESNSICARLGIFNAAHTQRLRPIAVAKCVRLLATMDGKQSQKFARFISISETSEASAGQSGSTDPGKSRAEAAG